jgi:hypothetical protein
MCADASARGNRAFQGLVISAMVSQRDHHAPARDVPNEIQSAWPLGRERQHDEPAGCGASIAGDEPRAARLRD